MSYIYRLFFLPFARNRARQMVQREYVRVRVCDNWCRQIEQHGTSPRSLSWRNSMHFPRDFSPSLPSSFPLLVNTFLTLARTISFERWAEENISSSRNKAEDSTCAPILHGTFSSSNTPFAVVHTHTHFTSPRVSMKKKHPEHARWRPRGKNDSPGHERRE